MEERVREQVYSYSHRVDSLTLMLLLVTTELVIGLKSNLCYFSCRKGDRIYHQLRKSGCSLDWDRAFFTMDNVGVKRPGVPRPYAFWS